MCPAQIFASHTIGGVVGNILTGLFAQASVAGFDGIAAMPGGWLDHHYIQLGIQLADSVAGMSYSFLMTVRVRRFACNALLIDNVDNYPVANALYPLPSHSFRT